MFLRDFPIIGHPCGLSADLALRANSKNSKKGTLAPVPHWRVSSPNHPHSYPLRTTSGHRVIGFVGQYEHQMDPKGRVSLPSAFRRQGEGERFVLIQWEPSNLTLFPEQKWEDLQAELLEFRRKNPRGANQLRRVVANAVEVVPDKQGRILVPAALQAGAGLSGAVLLVGAIDRVELWNPGTYGNTVERDGGDLGDFAHQLFG